MRSVRTASGPPLEQAIKEEARRLGFLLAGFTTPDPPQHLSAFEQWLMQGRHAAMHYLAGERSRLRRADPRRIMPECKSILVLASPYSKPGSRSDLREGREAGHVTGRIAAYAWGDDYHTVFAARLQALVAFIEAQVGHPVSSLWYADTGPLLERDLAQRAGLGWIGKNTCLINPRQGSYFLLAEILLDLQLEPDAALTTDHCGKCTRCIQACPTKCILGDRTIDAGRCISYLTIELKDGIPRGLRSLMGDWIFGCDVCQIVCPWNRFAASEGDAAFGPQSGPPEPDLIQELTITPQTFRERFKNSAVRRAKLRGYKRNVAVAVGNTDGPAAIAALQTAAQDEDPMVQEHFDWAIHQIIDRAGRHD